MAISSIGSRSGLDLASMAAKMVKDLDTNKDNSLSKAEFIIGMKTKGISQVDAEKMFNAIDTKGTGKITQADIETALKSTGSKGGPPAGMHPGGGGGRPGGAHGSGSAGSSSQTSSSKTYDIRDTNKDGKVSAEELLAYDIAHPQPKAPVASSSTIDVTV